MPKRAKPPGLPWRVRRSGRKSVVPSAVIELIVPNLGSTPQAVVETQKLVV